MTTNTYELCILVLHHRDDAVTRLHFDKVQRAIHRVLERVVRVASRLIP